MSFPLFFSRRVLSTIKTLKRAAGPWALDSGGFSELSMYGEWRTSPEQYVDEVRRFVSDIGNMEWASIQDWMCEPAIRKNTGKTVDYHQKMTIESYLKLNDLAPEVNWAPVIQGFVLDDYIEHHRMYSNANIDLSDFDVVGVGSICRRQAASEISEIIKRLHRMNINMHGFGIKKGGIIALSKYLRSADSMSWSFDAGYDSNKQGGLMCRLYHAKCSSCLLYATKWREELLQLVV